MKFFFELLQEHLPLAVAEIEALITKKNSITKKTSEIAGNNNENNNNESQLIGNLLFIDCKNKNEVRNTILRLAYSHAVYKVLFSCEYADFIEKVKIFNWQKEYSSAHNNFSMYNHHPTHNNSFRVRLHNFRDINFCDIKLCNIKCVHVALKEDITELKIADIIWHSIKNPKVNLKFPNTSFDFFMFNNAVFCGMLVSTNPKTYAITAPTKRAVSTPSTMQSRLARCLVNITGIKKGTLIDLFCGSGGILLEAGQVGVKAIGIDNDILMVNRAKKNIEFFHFEKKIAVHLGNALEFKNKIKYLVSDLPYGKNTKKQNFIELYRKFLTLLSTNLTGRAVIVFPSFAPMQEIFKGIKLRIKQKFIFFVHDSLSRVILVVEHNKK